MVAATVSVYNAIREAMLPTPAKSHYTFNLRDLARVIQGVLRADSKEVAKDPKELLSLWLHENLRVFSDRLVRKPIRHRRRRYIFVTDPSDTGGA
eukprot:9475364-Pyramimonas_sp.AAC.1